MKLYFQDVNVSSTSRLPQKRNYTCSVGLWRTYRTKGVEFFIFVFNLNDYYNHFWWSRFSLGWCDMRGFGFQNNSWVCITYNENCQSNFRILFFWLYANLRLYRALRIVFSTPFQYCYYWLNQLSCRCSN